MLLLIMKYLILLFTGIFISISLLAQPDDAKEQKISILLNHRYSGGFNPRGYEQFDYTGLFKINNKFYLKPTRIIVETSYDACSGDSIFNIFTTGTEECLYLFSGLKPYTKGNIKTHAIAENRRFVAPKKNYIFDFNKKHYSFTGDGEETEPGVILNYRLILTDENTGKSQIIIKETALEKTKVEILFVGDLDGDTKPDFIINAPPYPETRNILLFLSSKAQNGEMVTLSSQQLDWFDC